MKDKLELAFERIDQQADTIIRQAERIQALEALLKEEIEAEEIICNECRRIKLENSQLQAVCDMYHKMKGEAVEMVTQAQHRHLKCANVHGCPKDVLE